MEGRISVLFQRKLFILEVSKQLSGLSVGLRDYVGYGGEKWEQEGEKPSQMTWKRGGRRPGLCAEAGALP